MTTFHNLKLEGQLDLRYFGGGEWLLLAPYSAIWRDGRVDVPTGFQTDLSSIPRIARSIIPQIGDQNGPSVIHDWCYRYRWETRAVSDALFLAGMRAAGVNWLRRKVMYLAVRAGGWTTWNKRKPK